MNELRPAQHVAAALFLAAAASPTVNPAAHASMTLSSAATVNVSCAAGVCTATAAEAVLNMAELGNMLVTSGLRISSGPAAQNIVVAAPFTWGSGNPLTLDASGSIRINKHLAGNGLADLALITNDGGTGGSLSFGQNGRISFKNTASALRIDGRRCRLVRSIAQLASEISARPFGCYALADNFDASVDGSYSRVPIPTEFGGIFEGLGNIISNFSLYDTQDHNVAMFGAIKSRGILRNVTLTNVSILSENTFVQFLAPLAAYNAGTISQCQATGAIRSDFWVIGGGLVALSYGTIEKSFADVFVSGAQNATVGGLVGNSHGQLRDVYATGRVIAGDNSDVGGLVGYFIGRRVIRTYATGEVSGGQSALVGGLMGESRPDVLRNSYWDLTTSHTTKGVGLTNAPGVTGLTTKQFQSGLPSGFGVSTWAESKAVNGGLPYLIANPPR